VEVVRSWAPDRPFGTSPESEAIACEIECRTDDEPRTNTPEPNPIGGLSSSISVVKPFSRRSSPHALDLDEFDLRNGRTCPGSPAVTSLCGDVRF
jgi:hypothetical protein